MSKGDRDDQRALRPRTVQLRWSEVLLVCGKCLDRHPDGKSIRRTLKEAASARMAGARDGRGRPAKVRLVKTACLGLCPKRALVVASAASLSGREVALLREAGDVPAAVAQLLPDRPSPAQA